jgi:hypothetical protein
MKTIVPILRYILIIFGLAGIGIIVYEILQKWHIVDQSLNSVWILSPILILFFCKEFFKSAWIQKKQLFTERQTAIALKIINFFLVVITIIALISIPFIWFGTIEELAGRSGGKYTP